IVTVSVLPSAIVIAISFAAKPSAEARIVCRPGSTARLTPSAAALDRYAEATLYPGGHRVVKDADLKRVLLALTTPSGARATRPPAASAGGAPGADRPVRVLEEARLLVRESTREGDRLTISHEALAAPTRPQPGICRCG